MPTDRRRAGLIAALLLGACSPAGDEANAGAPTAAPSPAAPPENAMPEASPSPAAAAAVDLSDVATLAGRYTVTGVGVGAGVGAFAKDDPAYMGRALTIAADRIGWEAGAPAGNATLDDRCATPALQPLAGASADNYRKEFADQLAGLGMTGPSVAAVECVEGNWGPEAAGGAILFASADGALAMSWYDGVVLKLARAG